MTVLPPLQTTPAPLETPDWPLVSTLPDEMVGIRINPLLSKWLKERRKKQRKVGRVVIMAQPSVAPLRVDYRKWPDVKVEQVSDLASLPDKDVSFLWTPFALQRAKDRLALLQETQRVVVPGGSWVLVDVMPASMPGHWLYRLFPQVWENERKHAWDTSRMYNALMEAGFQVQFKRRNIYQAIALEVAHEIAGKREQCPQLAILPDPVYTAGLDVLEQKMEQEGPESLLGPDFCLVEVVAVRG